MKLVQFLTRDAGLAIGEERVLPDEMADEMIAAGTAQFKPSIFDNQPSTPKAQPQRFQRRRQSAG